MTQQEITELRDLRTEDQVLKDKIHMIESEIMDIDMRLRFLMRSKKGKGLGLFISLFCFGLSISALLSYLLLYMDSSGNRMEGYADVLVFSVTASMIPFIVIGVMALGIVTMVLALFLVMDLWPSNGAYRSAVKHHRVNIPHEKKECVTQRIELQKSLDQLKMEHRGIQGRLEELRKKEQEMLWNN